ncbi:MAG: tripartite tricarboxylate transporter TctB family protein, partial [Alphaproteobacteria bacterium]|nr:tripartite tricarboxylate transporter TctB family protein [Alphaproteobacteria bacterium]
PAAERTAEAEAKTKPGLLGWLDRYRNALICYALFLAFLLSLPVLGMLIGGALFVFATLSALGAPSLRLVPMHLAVAVGSVGVMWAIFTFGLRVFLPEGMILQF